MFKCLNDLPKKPQRVVILGANGFVGSTAAARLKEAEIEVLALTRQEIDLLSVTAKEQLTSVLQPNDSLVVACAEAPCKDVTMLMNNFRMMHTICNALEQLPVSHLLYISSDAVYADSDQPLTENSDTVPTSLHGMMHLTREMMLHTVSDSTPLCILRPSLLYGAADPHNGYGPNQFRRLAAQGKAIVLFGNGEEERDHVFINDLGEIIYLCLAYKAEGILNVATGRVASFYQIATMVNKLFDSPVKVTKRSRNGPMPHNGYRPFNINLCRKVFPNFHCTALEDGIALAHKEMVKKAGVE